MFSDIRFACRQLIKNPGFTATSLITLALCIGANLVIFAVVDAILVRPLPFPRAGRLVTMYYVYPKLPSASPGASTTNYYERRAKIPALSSPSASPGASTTNYYERRAKIPALSSLAAIDENTSVIGESGSTSIERLGRVTSEFFSTLGVAPLLGRAFTDAEMT